MDDLQYDDVGGQFDSNANAGEDPANGWKESFYGNPSSPTSSTPQNGGGYIWCTARAHSAVNDSHLWSAHSDANMSASTFRHAVGHYQWAAADPTLWAFVGFAEIKDAWGKLESNDAKIMSEVEVKLTIAGSDASVKTKIEAEQSSSEVPILVYKLGLDADLGGWSYDGGGGSSGSGGTVPSAGSVSLGYTAFELAVKVTVPGNTGSREIMPPRPGTESGSSPETVAVPEIALLTGEHFGYRITVVGETTVVSQLKAHKTIYGGRDAWAQVRHNGSSQYTIVAAPSVPGAVVVPTPFGPFGIPIGPPGIGVTTPGPGGPRLTLTPPSTPGPSAPVPDLPFEGPPQGPWTPGPTGVEWEPIRIDTNGHWYVVSYDESASATPAPEEKGKLALDPVPVDF